MSTPQNNTSFPRFENGFYYQREDLEGIVTRATEHTISVGALASRMVVELRTRTHHLDGRAENDAEHAHMVSRVSTAMFRRFQDQLPTDMDEGLIGLFADIHDDVEAYVLDTATDFISEEGIKQKELREAEGARQLYAEHVGIDPVYAERIRQYEKQEDPNARWVRLWDKFTTVLIHIPNKGKILRETYESCDAYLVIARNHYDELRAQFPEFAWVLEIRDELAVYVAELAWPETEV